MQRRSTSAAAPDPAPSQEAVGTWLAVVRAYNQCDALMARRLAVLGVRTAEHEILANLLRDPGLTQQALAQRCFTAKSHMSGLLNALADRGWVRREANTADARSKQLYLTTAGEGMALQTASVQAEVVAEMCRSESDDDLLAVKAAMFRVSERLQRMLEPD